MTSGTPQPSSASQLLAAIARSLAGHPYMVIGGQAVLLYGDPRVTQDIDVTLGLGPDRAQQVLALVQALGLRPLVAEPEAFVRESLVLPLAHDATGLRVDLIFSFTDYERGAIERAKTVRVNETEVRFASAEDVIIHKLFAGRARDLEDVQGILSRRPTLDTAYVKHWLGILEEGTEKSLQSSFITLARDAGLNP